MSANRTRQRPSCLVAQLLALPLMLCGITAISWGQPSDEGQQQEQRQRSSSRPAVPAAADRDQRLDRLEGTVRELQKAIEEMRREGGSTAAAALKSLGGGSMSTA